MRIFLIVILCVFSISISSQAIVGKPWTFEVGLSSNNLFKTSYCYNIRYISPRFKWSDYELNAEEEKREEEFKNSRLMMELLYAPLFKLLSLGFNVQSRVLRYKRLSMDLYGGMKFFIKQSPEFGGVSYLNSGSDIWYMNMGVLFQLNLGMLSPFADIGGDRLITVGTEINLHRIYKRPKGRYRLKLNKR